METRVTGKVIGFQKRMLNEDLAGPVRYHVVVILVLCIGRLRAGALLCFAHQPGSNPGSTTLGSLPNIE